MPVIDPKGLFDGQRLAACSDLAQLYWPRFFCAANGYARLELHYPAIAGRCFHGFREVPTEHQVFAVIKEYADNYLLIPYQVNGQLWVQFATEDKFLRRRKTADDERSPAPPAACLDTFKAGYAAWKEERQATTKDGDGAFSKLFPTYFQKLSDEFLPGVGIGVGVGAGDGESVVDLDESDQTLFGEATKEQPPSQRPKAQQYVDYWNAHRGTLSAVEKFTDSRQRKLQARIAHGLTPERFKAVVEKVQRTPFLLGDSDRGWKVTFDFIIANDDNVAKILEGNYDRTKKPQPVRREMTDPMEMVQ